MKRLSRSLLVLILGLSPSVPFARADEAGKTAAPAKPPQAKDEPTVPSVKGSATDPKNAFVKRHEGFLKDKERLLAKGPIQMVFIGDSITDGWRGKGKETFAANYDKYNAYNIGISGDRTQHVLWRIDNGELDGINPNPKVAELMIGTNNLKANKSDEEIAAGVTKIVEEIHQKLPKTKVLLLAIFPRGEAADNEFRPRIRHINEILAKLDDGGKTVKFLDVGPKFLEPDGTLPASIMPDWLHPNAKGYEIWAEATKPTIDELMK